MVCARCHEDKPDSAFYPQSASGRRHSYCKPCFNAYTHERFKRRKQNAIAYKGGACEDCGGVLHYSVYEFHHRDPTQKDLRGNQLKRLGWQTVRAELGKCDLLCANCHRMRHWGEA